MCDQSPRLHGIQPGLKSIQTDVVFMINFVPLSTVPRITQLTREELRQD